MIESRNGVCVGLVRDERMLVVRTRRYPDMWQPIGGRLEEREAFVDAAVREVWEETGWVIRVEDLVLVSEHRMDAHKGMLRFFLCLREPTQELQVDAAELVEHRWVTPQEAVMLPAFDAAQQFFARWARGITPISVDRGLPRAG